MKTLPLPDFYDPKQISQLYLERAGQIAEAGEAYAKQHGIAPAAQDKQKIAAFGIDVQVGFCTPGASLFVPGAVEDTTRTVEWLYRHLDKISGLFFSMDTHRVFQIFHPSWWVDAKGNHPAPFTPIFHEEVRAGKWTAVAHPKESLEYTKRLEASGKYVLTIWPYHTLLGGLTHALVPAVMEAALFHASAWKRGRQRPLATSARVSGVNGAGCRPSASSHHAGWKIWKTLCVSSEKTSEVMRSRLP